MKKQSLFFTMVLAVIFMTHAFAMNVSAQTAAQWGELVENIGNGSVNWSTGVIEAKGIGVPPERFYGKPQARPMALRAAKMDAMRNLLETTKGVRIDSATQVKDYVVESDVIMSRVQGIVKGAQVVKQEYMDDGTVEVTMQMSLNGDLAHVVLPKQPPAPTKPVTPPQVPATTEPTPPTPQPTTPPVVEPTTPPDDQKTTFTSLKDSAVFTGMVVDARGLSARPAMSPKIVDENGQEVYGSAFVSREFAVQQGMSGYAKDLSAAQKNQRVTDNPVTVKGIKTSGAGRSDIIISNADAGKLRGAAENLSFLKKCRVMIVVD